MIRTSRWAWVSLVTALVAAGLALAFVRANPVVSAVAFAVLIVAPWQALMMSMPSTEQAEARAPRNQASTPTRP